MSLSLHQGLLASTKLGKVQLSLKTLIGESQSDSMGLLIGLIISTVSSLSHSKKSPNSKVVQFIDDESSFLGMNFAVFRGIENFSFLSKATDTRDQCFGRITFRMDCYDD